MLAGAALLKGENKDFFRFDANDLKVIPAFREAVLGGIAGKPRHR